MSFSSIINPHMSASAFSHQTICWSSYPIIVCKGVSGRQALVAYITLPWYIIAVSISSLSLVSGRLAYIHAFMRSDTIYSLLFVNLAYCGISSQV